MNFFKLTTKKTFAFNQGLFFEGATHFLSKMLRFKIHCQGPKKLLRLNDQGAFFEGGTRFSSKNAALKNHYKGPKKLLR